MHISMNYDHAELLMALHAALGIIQQSMDPRDIPPTSDNARYNANDLYRARQVAERLQRKMVVQCAASGIYPERGTD